MTWTEEEVAEPAPAPTRRRPSMLGVVGVLLLLAGLGCLGWVAYQYLGTNVVSQRAFEQERTGLREQWTRESGPDPAQPDSEPDPGSDQQSDPAQPDPDGRQSDERAPGPAAVPGDAIALLRIPALGESYEIPILSGTDLSFLDRGVGHYTSTAQPGQVGNFAIAGHRVTHGQPFARLLELDRGDEVVVETRDAIYTYVLDQSPRDLTVPDSATWVLDPVPGQAGAAPSQPLITLTTCQDLFRSPDRSIGFGHLASTQNKG